MQQSNVLIEDLRLQLRAVDAQFSTTSINIGSSGHNNSIAHKTHSITSVGSSGGGGGTESGSFRLAKQ